MTDMFVQPDMTGLSEEEKNQVMLVMQKAKEFEAREEMSLMMQPLEGSLSKYTNVVKGFQPRWFVLDPISGLLHYFEKEEQKKLKPRGSVDLAAASVCPSDEDGLMFTLNAANGDIYKLRALDARERQHWVNRLRATAEHHTSRLAHTTIPTKENSSFSTHEPSTVSQHNGTHSISNESQDTGHDLLPQGGKVPRNQTQSRSKTASVISGTGSKQETVDTEVQNALKHVRDLLTQVQTSHLDIINNIQKLPESHGTFNYLNKDILLLKATSSATFSSLEDSLAILQQQSKNLTWHKNSEQTALEPIETYEDSQQYQNVKMREINDPVSPSDSFVSAADNTDTENAAVCTSNGPSMSADEVEDCDDSKESKEMEGLEEQKSIILHLLSQLKLGMDLTKVVLPTFILERRSLLEMFADFMAHPDLFTGIADCTDPESRMLAMVEWYLTSFHAGRNGAVAKKPYNPIIGETFHCSWHVTESQNNPSPSTPTNQTFDSGIFQNNTPTHTNSNSTPQPDRRSLNSNSNNSRSDDEESDSLASADDISLDASSTSQQKYSLRYCAEQVSHHPPVSAFYVECSDKQMYLNGSIWTKSKFMGMSVGVMMIGKISLHLLSHGEEYIFSLPSAYARSILTVPWVELGDKISIHCPQTGMSANVTFHTKPFYGGKLHRTTAEVKDANGEVISRVAGEWNGCMEFSYEKKEAKVVDTSCLKIMQKCVRPIGKQDDNESRRLWKDVTDSLARGDVHEATRHKHKLEEEQRTGERHRKETNTPYPTKYFKQVEGEHAWVYKTPLQSQQSKPVSV